jgi:hypothetical protein
MEIEIGIEVEIGIAIEIGIKNRDRDGDRDGNTVRKNTNGSSVGEIKRYRWR